MNELQNIIFEAGQLKRVKRSGWWLAGVRDPESVAEHTYRALIIGHLLAKTESADPYKVLILILYHDLPEARLNDPHKIAQRYMNFDKTEKRVLFKQLSSLLPISPELKNLFNVKRPSLEHKIARDADILECVCQGKEYYEQGYRQANEWFQGKLKFLKTKSAKKLYRQILKTKSTAWRKNLKKFR